MKNLIGLLVLCFTIGTVSIADAQLGVKVMGNYSVVYGEAEEVNGTAIEDAKFGPGFAVGVFYRAGEGAVAFQGELMYEQRSSTSIKEFDAAHLNFTSENSYSFINVPLLAVLNLWNFKPYVGLNVGYLISAKATQSGSIGPVAIEGQEVDYLGKNEHGTDYSDNPYFNQLELGANLGIMFQLSDAFHIDLRVMHDLTDFTNNDYDKSLIDGSARSDSDKNLSFNLGVGLSF